MIYLVLVLGTLLFVLLLLPTLAPARVTAQDTRRTELEEERDALLRSVRELEQAGAESGLLTREKVRLTAVLTELDHLPPAPPALARPALPLAAGVLLGVALLAGVGVYTVFPKWRYAGLSANEAAQLQNASRLPALEARAERSGDVADYTALGDAAWDAKNYQLAAKAYAQVLLKDRANAKAMRRTGFFLLSDKKMAENGLIFIRESVNADPKAPEGQLLYGYALGLFGQYGEGLKVLKNYQALAPDSHEADDLIVEFQGRTGSAIDGGLVFAQNCAACHGSGGQGGTGPKLLGSAALKDDAALRQKILSGGVGMPAFPQLQGQQLDALVKYVQNFK